MGALGMGLKSKTCLSPLGVVGVVLVTAALQAATDAQIPQGPVRGTMIRPAAMITVEEAETRTPEDLDGIAAASDPVLPAAEVPPFRPTMDASAYQSAKQAAAARKESRPFVRALAPLAPPVLKGPNFNGVSEGASCKPFLCAPPDTHGAIGLNHFVEVTNSRISIYTRGRDLVKSVSLNAFFGYPLTSPNLFGGPNLLFDPRVVYDPTWNRWVITAEALPESFDKQLFFIGVSKTSNPTGGFFKYSIDVNDPAFGSASGDFFDYPQLGMDQDAVITTANIFDSFGSFKYAEVFAIAKARLYNGLSLIFPVFTGLDGTLAPPIVLDQNPGTFLVAATAGTGVTGITKYELTNSSRPDGAALVESTMTVAAYSVPPGAAQPGTASELDTLDARFVNAGTQVGDSLWNVHTVEEFAGSATPRFYELNTATDTVIQSGNFFASATSDDFNASIAANESGEAFVTWSSTDTSANARVMFSGRQSGDASGDMNAAPGGTVLFTSPTFYDDFTCPLCRWGDYSAVTLDPKADVAAGCAAGRRAWIVNEKINSNTVWGSRIGRIGFC